MKIARSGHQAKGISSEKWSVRVKNLKGQIHAKNHFRRTSELFCAKNLSKMLTVGQKLKIQINRLKTFLQDIAVFLCKKWLEKIPTIQKMRPFSKLQKWPQSKGYSLCKMLTLGQKLKMQKKHAKNVSTRHCSCSMQKTARKNT